MSEVRNVKEVYFNAYCGQCKYADIQETDDPCNECLANPSNINTHKPVMYVPKND